jgi:hypothetical protein
LLFIHNDVVRQIIKVDLGWRNYVDLKYGRAKGRENDRQQGLQFSSVCGYLYKKAKAMGLGREFPTEWFLRDIRD